MNAAQFILAADVEPDRPAIIHGQRVVTHGQLRQSVDQWAAALAARGVSRGDRCLLIADNSPAWPAAYLAILTLGLVAVPLSPKAESAQLAEIVASTQPAAAAIDARHWPRLAASLPQACHVVLDSPSPSADGRAVAVSQFAAADAPAMAEVNGNADLAALFFTSGSTGTPRGVMVSHRNLIANTESILAYLPLSSDDRILQVLPMHYCFGTSLLHTHLRAGASIVIDNNFLFPDRVLETMRQTRCTGFAGVPATYQILLRRSGFARTTFPDLRYLLQAGGKLSDQFIDELRLAQPGASLFVMYGQTEATARLSYLPPEMLQAKRGSIGRGIPGVTLRVIDETGQAVRPGQTGQIIARGDNITLGYWQSPAESAEVFRDGWLYTGDMATIDADGFIYIVGRAREFLKLGGTRVACQQLEQVVLKFSGTVEAAVVGMPDPYLGETAALFIVHAGGESVREPLIQHLRDHLPPAHRPARIVFRSDLPHNASGKLDRESLRKSLHSDSTPPVTSPPTPVPVDRSPGGCVSR